MADKFYQAPFLSQNLIVKPLKQPCFLFCSIPLAKKLKNCGVFGVSSNEYLDYALKNRQEWEKKGQKIVAEMRGEEGGTAVPTKQPK